MPVIRPLECVGNFVQDRVPYFWLGVQQGKFLAQGDRVCAVLAETEPTDRPIKLKIPMGQTVFGHQLLSEGFGVFENHSDCLAAIYF
jgi:hypothetical protein